MSDIKQISEISKFAQEAEDDDSFQAILRSVEKKARMNPKEVYWDPNTRKYGVRAKVTPSPVAPVNSPEAVQRALEAGKYVPGSTNKGPESDEQLYAERPSRKNLLRNNNEDYDSRKVTKEETLDEGMLRADEKITPKEQEDLEKYKAEKIKTIPGNMTWERVRKSYGVHKLILKPNPTVKEETLDELKSSTLKSYADKRMNQLSGKFVYPGTQREKQFLATRKAYDKAAQKSFVPSRASIEEVAPAAVNLRSFIKGALKSIKREEVKETWETKPRNLIIGSPTPPPGTFAANSKENKKVANKINKEGPKSVVTTIDTPERAVKTVHTPESLKVPAPGEKLLGLTPGTSPKGKNITSWSSDSGVKKATGRDPRGVVTHDSDVARRKSAELGNRKTNEQIVKEGLANVVNNVVKSIQRTARSVGIRVVPKYTTNEPVMNKGLGIRHFNPDPWDEDDGVSVPPGPASPVPKYTPKLEKNKQQGKIK